MSKTTSKLFGPALSFRAVFLAVVAVALSYAAVLLPVVHAYRKAYGISYAGHHRRLLGRGAK